MEKNNSEQNRVWTLKRITQNLDNQDYQQTTKKFENIHIENKSTQRAQASTDAKISTESDPGFKSGFSD